MKKRKSRIKIFLGGYINSTNAQNLNCLSLAHHLNKAKFEVKTMVLYSGNLQAHDIPGVTYIYGAKPHRIMKYLSYIKGILWCDIAYLPKGEIHKYTRFLLKAFNRKSIKTVEGIFDDANLDSALAIHQNRKKFLNSFKGCSRAYSITDYLRTFNLSRLNIQTENKILYLGTDSEKFIQEERSNFQLQNIIYIGRILKRKGVFEIIELAQTFSSLEFHVVGEGLDEIEFENEKLGVDNIRIHGRLDHDSLAELLKDMNLHFFPSRSEGFPKVTLETASAGVPSIVYPDYGAEEWITNEINGFVVQDLAQAKEKIEKLIVHPLELQKVSREAVALGKSFDWKTRIKDWESEFESLYYA